MFAASRHIEHFDVLLDEEAHCLRWVQVKCAVRRPAKLAVAPTAPSVAESRVFGYCDCVVQPAGDLLDRML